MTLEKKLKVLDEQLGMDPRFITKVKTHTQHTHTLTHSRSPCRPWVADLTMIQFSTKKVSCEKRYLSDSAHMYTYPTYIQ